MGEDGVIFTLEIDASSAVSSLDELDAAVASVGESAAEMASSATESLASLDDILAALNDLTAAVSDGFSSLDASLSTLDESVMGVSAAVDNLESSLSALAAAEGAGTAGAEGEAESFDLLGAAAEAASGAMDALQAAQGPLMMIATAAGMAGGALFKMGSDGQKGEALLSGMAGASQADIQALQADALKLGVNMTDAASGFYAVESAGYAGSQAISVFDAAVRLAEGGQASESDTMMALTAIMHDYGAKSSDATHYTDLMATAVVRGKQNFSDFARSIGPLASAGENVGLSFQQVAAAEATMTQINPSVQRDSQQLIGLFQSLSPSMGGVVKTAKSLKLNFNETHYASLDLIGKLEYLAKLAGGTNTAAFVKLTGGVRGSTAAIDLLKGNAASFKGNLDAMGHSAGATEHAFSSWENTIPAHLDKAGAAISIFATKLMDALGPKLIPIIDKVTAVIGQLSDLIINHTSQVMPILAGLAGVLGGAIVGAIGALVVSMGPVLLVLGAIGLAVAGVVFAFQHWTQIMGGVHAAMQNPVMQKVMQILHEIGTFLVQTFTPVWKQLQDVWNTQLVPTFHLLINSLKPAMPLLQAIGMIIGGVVVLALGLLVGIITGVIKAFANLVGSIAIVFGGIVKIISGAISVIGGILSFFTDLLTGNWSNLGKDLKHIWEGIVTMLSGVWDVISGIFRAAVGVIWGLISGFVQGIIGFFQNLWDTLTGHSIVPDMVNDIIAVFKTFPDRAFAVFMLFFNWVNTMFGGLPAKMLSWGADMISGLISGIQSKIGGLVSTVQNVAGSIAKFLHFSKPEAGPLSDVDKWIPDMTDILEAGFRQQAQRLGKASLSVATTIAGPQAPSGTLAGNGTTNAVLAQILQTLQGQGRLQMGSQPVSAAYGTVNQSIGSLTFNGGSGLNGLSQNDYRTLYTILNKMAGQSAAYGFRGVTQGAF